MTNPGDRDTIAAMFSVANEKLASARSLHAQSYYNDALSLAYYAAFHGVSLLFFLKGQSFSRHGQLIGAFNKDFVVPGIFPKELGKALGRLYDARQSGDYDVFVKADREESGRGLTDAELILKVILAFIKQSYGIDLSLSQGAG